MDAPHHFIEHPWEPSQNIYFLCDVPHIVKCIRNHLRKHTYAMAGDLCINFRHYVTLYEAEKNKHVRVVPKLSEAHDAPDNLRKMSVRLATQNFKSGFGFNENVFKALALETGDMDINARHGGIVFDEMKLSEHFSVNTAGAVQGFVDLGKFTPEDEMTTPADHGMVMLFQPFQGAMIANITGNRPRVSDATAERVLERIAAGQSSDLDLSDSYEEAPEDVAVSSHPEDFEPDHESSDDEPVQTAAAPPKRAVLWKISDSLIGGDCLLCGEFNAAHPKWGSRRTDRHGRDLIAALRGTSLHVLNTGVPTFVRRGGVRTCIDLSIVSQRPKPGRRVDGRIYKIVHWDRFRDLLGSLPLQGDVLAHVASLIGGDCLLCGEFNAAHPKWGSRRADRHGRDLIAALRGTSLHVLNTGVPTFVRRGGVRTCIDLSIVSQRPKPGRRVDGRIYKIVHWDRFRDLLGSLPLQGDVLAHVASLIGGDCLLCGEFNAAHPKWGARRADRHGRDLIAALRGTSLHVLNTGVPTFVRRGGVRTCIDLSIVSQRPKPGRRVDGRIYKIVHWDRFRDLLGSLPLQGDVLAHVARHRKDKGAGALQNRKLDNRISEVVTKAH
ncbi:hypothetical protein V5799_004155 [Amblyomma americanum]|uniref:Endonuclease/exonuclease/phosphatase domain-containing protein n=2 Tax=Amblyomma americanum TaxID=6943 RepID=A0AAQ4D6X3_AMBAM